MRRAIIIAATGLLAIVGAWFLPDRVPEVATRPLVFTIVQADIEENDSTPRPRFVIMDDYIREFLAEEWDAYAQKPALNKLERGYCLRWQYDIWAGEIAYRVTQISQPDTVIEATNNGIMFRCKSGKPNAAIHIHPETTCIDGYCWNEGPYARQCAPSDSDRNNLIWKGHEFGMVQCARDASVFYFPMGDNR